MTSLHSVHCDETPTRGAASILVDTEPGLLAALEVLEAQREVAVDGEGVELSRSGPLTVLSVLPLVAGAVPYVFDVKELGARLFAADMPSLKRLLEVCATARL
jgi:hypothetical protein